MQSLACMCVTALNQWSLQKANGADALLKSFIYRCMCVCIFVKARVRFSSKISADHSLKHFQVIPLIEIKLQSSSQ